MTLIYHRLRGEQRYSIKAKIIKTLFLLYNDARVAGVSLRERSQQVKTIVDIESRKYPTKMALNGVMKYCDYCVEIILLVCLFVAIN